MLSSTSDLICFCNMIILCVSFGKRMSFSYLSKKKSDLKITQGVHMMDLHKIIAQLDTHHNDIQLRETMSFLCFEYLPFSLSELERLSAPMIRLFLTGRTGFDIDKGILTKRILQRLHVMELNPLRAFEVQRVLRDFSVALSQHADKKGIIIKSYFPTAA
jgi:hypothetical protein